MNVPEVVIRKILYTTNLSETGRYAFAHAASLSKVYGAKLSVMHVVNEQKELDRRLVGYMPEEIWETIKSRDLEEAKEILINRQRENGRIIGECVGQYCSEIQAGSTENNIFNYDIVVQLGDPVQEIVKYATEHEYDLIVVGRHVHNELQRIVHRGIVRSLLDATNLPVLVVQIPK